MSNKDIAVPVSGLQNATGALDQRPAPFKGSIFLVRVEQNKIVESFLCSRIDKHPAHIEIIAVSVDEKKLAKCKDSYLLMDKNLLTEMYFPWNRIVSIRNLNYKAK